MEVDVIEKDVPSSDGIHVLKGKLYIPQGEIKALFHVVHGMTEYIDRYDRFMKSVAAEGFLVFGYDNLGHGKTAGEKENLGFIAHKKGWDYLSRDVFTFADEVKKDYPELKYYLMGHSMGSFIVRCSAAFYKKPDKLIIMGTGGPNAFAGAGLTLVKTAKLLKGEKYRSKFVDRLTFGKYNERFKGESDEHCWLTKNKEVRERFDNDEYCNFKFTLSAMCDLIKLNKLSNSGRFYEEIDKKMPIFLIAGSDDPVGDYGDGVRKVYRKLISAGANARISLYDGCRHEILNDTSEEAVTEEIKDFLNT